MTACKQHIWQQVRARQVVWDEEKSKWTNGDGYPFSKIILGETEFGTAIVFVCPSCETIKEMIVGDGK
jgi:hypothetical protein